MFGFSCLPILLAEYATAISAVTLMAYSTFAVATMVSYGLQAQPHSMLAVARKIDDRSLP